MKKNVLAYYDDATLEYNANRSLFEENKRLAEENKKLKQEVKKITRERDMCEMALAISKPEEEEEDTNDGV
jgi:cell division septum initiation protein DivIVA